MKWDLKATMNDNNNIVDSNLNHFGHKLNITGSNHTFSKCTRNILNCAILYMKIEWFGTNHEQMPNASPLKTYSYCDACSILSEHCHSQTLATVEM